MLFFSEVLFIDRFLSFHYFLFLRLRSEIDQFLKAENQLLHELCNPLWLADLDFLVDLHDHLNTLNKRLQGKDQLVSDLYMELKSFCMLLSLYESQLTNCECDHFPTLLEPFLIQRPKLNQEWENM